MARSGTVKKKRANPIGRAPYIKMPIPGPKSKALIELDTKYSSSCYTRYVPLAVKRGFGCTIEDLDGNRFLDFTAGIAVNACGHCHPDIVKAIRDQAGKLIHMCGSDYYNEPMALLAEKLCSIAPGPSPKSVYFTNSGAESIEAALKLARYHSGRQRVIAFLGGFHGRTFGALSLTGSKISQRANFAPLVPEIHHVPFGFCYRCPYHLKFPTCKIECVSVIENTLFKTTVPPNEVAAIFVEPIQGEGGYIVPPEGYLAAIRDLCDRHGILMVADEIQTGFGRTGKMFAFEHAGIEPDIICMAKGIASGMPIGAMVAKKSVMDWMEGAHGSTYGGNPISCRAALASIELIEKEYMKNARKAGKLFFNRLERIAKKYPNQIGQVRGKGLMIGVEIIKDRVSVLPNPELRNAIVDAAFYEGLVLLGCGESVIRFCPALCISKTEVTTGLDIFEHALAAAVSSASTRALVR